MFRMRNFFAGAVRRRARRPRVSIGLLYGGVSLLLLATAGWAAGYRLNLTPSYPVGLWRIVASPETARRGDLVLVCPPDTAPVRLAQARHYLPAGGCSVGVQPLLKRLVALPGDRVVVTSEAVTINGRPIPNSAPLLVDPSGRPMPVATGGLVPPGAAWLLSDYHRLSFDSRYIGPMDLVQLRGVVAPVLVSSVAGAAERSDYEGSRD
jgi:conjugative transfer signal peptidase TraF